MRSGSSLRAGRERFISGRVAKLVCALVCTTFPGAFPGAAEREAVGAEYDFEEFNFAYTRPDKGWRKLDAKKINPDAELLFLKTRPAIYFMVIAERLGSSVSTDALNEIARAQLASASEESDFLPNVDRPIDGVDGRLFEANCEVDGKDLSYRHWQAAHNGYGYQLVAFSRARDARHLDRAFDDLVAGFELLDRNRTYEVEGARPAKRHESDAFGYAFVPPPNWQASSRSELGINTIDYVATVNGANGVLAIIALPVEHQTSTVEEVATVSFAQLGFTYPGTEVRETGRRDGAPGSPVKQAVEFEGSSFRSETDYGFFARLLRSERCAYFVIAWAPRGQDSTIRRVREAMDRVEVRSGSYQPGRLEPEHRAGVAGLLNELGLQAYQRSNYRLSTRRLGAALDLDPTNSLILENLAEAIRESRGPAESAREVESRLEKNPMGRSGRLILARALARAERHEEAIRVYDAVSAADGLSDDDLYLLGTAAAAVETYEEALRAYDREIESRGGTLLRRWRATLYSRAGRHDEAIQELTGLVELDPSDEVASFTLAEAYRDADRHDEALRVAEDLLANNRGDASLLRLLGEIYAMKGDFSESKASLEKAAKADPGDAYTAELLEQVSAMLGRGDTRRIREPIEPVALPPVVARRIEELSGAGLDGSENGFVEASRSVGFEFRKGERTRRTRRRSFRVLDRRGVEAFTSIDFSFDPLNERLFINELVVRDADGRKIAEGDLDDYYVLDDPDAGHDTYDQVAVAPIPMVRVGCTIDVTVTTESRSADELFGFREGVLSGYAPVGVSAFFVSGDVDALAHRSNGPTCVEEQGLLYWCAERPLTLREEPLQRSISYFLPTVWVSDAGETWAGVGAEYCRELRDVLEEDVETGELARRLTRDLGADREKAAALARYVRDELTYNAIEFGVRSQIPNEVRRVRHNRFGDCKDHSLLLHHLLRGAGIPSRLALANTSGPIVVGLPSLDQFDHMVVSVDLGEGRRLAIDATDKNTDPLAPAPHGLARKQLLVLDEDESRLVRTPAYPDDAFRIACRRDVEIEVSEAWDDARLIVDETIVLSTYAARSLRSALRSLGSRERKQALLDLIDADESVDLEATEIDGIEEFSKPLKIRMLYTRHEAFQPVPGAGERLVGRLPYHWCKLYVSPDRVIDRTTPFENTEPTLIQAVVRVRHPSDARLASKQLAGRRGGSGSMKWRVDGDVDSSGVEFTQVVRNPEGAYDARAYDDYDKAKRRFLRLIGGPMTLERVDSGRAGE